MRLREFIKRSPALYALARLAVPSIAAWRRTRALLAQLQRALSDALHSDTRATLSFAKFEHRAPSPQNAVDLFAGRWMTLGTGAAVRAEGTRYDLFAEDGDTRPALAARALGVRGRFDGMSVLELGPLEGAHAYRLEQLGAASVLGVEANAEHFLRCLIIKEALALARTRFMLGDAIEYLAGTHDRFDVVFCAGILYHMEDPVRLIELLERVTDRIFVYTHYQDPDRAAEALHRVPEVVTRHGRQVTYYRHPNQYIRGLPIFLGGNKETSAWMERDAILDWFRWFGFRTEVLAEDRTYRDGSNFCFAAERSRSLASD